MLNRVTLDIDTIGQLIKPMLNKIKPNSRVGFDANVDSVANYSLFYSAKFIAAPNIILCQKGMDTMLTIQLKSTGITPIARYRVVCRSENHDLLLLLSVKTR